MNAADGQFNALVSVHDVMPETLTRIEAIISLLRDKGVEQITLLVVPGRNWNNRQLAWLRERQQEGLILAGHGWQHQVARRKTLYHKLHGVVLSRMVAEHLSLSEQEIARLIERCFQWFSDQGLSAPSLYVPPAWARGPVRNSTLDTLPFQYYEDFSGVYYSDKGRRVRLPLTGYEADNRLRAPILAAWNRCNEFQSRVSGKPLRITVHPHDLELGLTRQLVSQLGRAKSFVGYHQVL